MFIEYQSMMNLDINSVPCGYRILNEIDKFRPEGILDLGRQRFEKHIHKRMKEGLVVEGHLHEVAI